MESTKITEVSVFYSIDTPPKVPIDKLIPFVVDARGHEIERVIAKNELVGDIPGWVLHPKTPNLRLVYATPEQDVECTYYAGKDVLVCRGVRFSNMHALQARVNTLLFLLGTSSSLNRAMYKACSVVRVPGTWDRDIFANIITNNHEVSQFVAVNEISGTLGTKRSLPMNVLAGGSCIRAVVTPLPNPNMISIKLSRLPHPDTAHAVISALHNVLSMYRGAQDCDIEDDCSMPLRGIDELRREVPELFTKNYTRECPILPMIVPTSAVQKYVDAGNRVILYPNDDPVHGRYYTGPEGLFVGLKRNRLNNKDIFPYLVTCYMSDHMERPNSETYMYYTGSTGRRRTREYTTYRQVPRSISTMDNRYSRVGIRRSPDSLLVALEKATGQSGIRQNLVWAPHLVKQELWDEEDNVIMDTIRGAGYVSGSLVYRYFEELLHISIHVVVIRNGKFDSLLPRHVEPYIWAPSYPSHVVVFENIKSTYGDMQGSHELLVRRADRSMLLDSNDLIVSLIVENKMRSSVRPDNVSDAVAQLIDDNGKCRMVQTSTGNVVPTFTRPLSVPVMGQPACFFDDHIQKMNIIKQSIGLQPTDLTKRSTRHVRYFPNNASFKEWMKLMLAQGH
jgi:hypothetical protein